MRNNVKPGRILNYAERRVHVIPAKAGTRHSRKSGYTSFPRKRESRRRRVVTKQPAIYILASKRNGTLCIGVIGDLVKRVWQHKNDVLEGLTKKYGMYTLVYYEMHATMAEAIRREKQLKKWNRA